MEALVEERCQQAAHLPVGELHRLDHGTHALVEVVRPELDAGLTVRYRYGLVYVEVEGTQRWELPSVFESDGGHKVHAEEETTRTDPNDPEKTITERSSDHDVEWQLLRDLHPEEADKIDATAKQKGAKAEKAAKELTEAFQ